MVFQSSYAGFMEEYACRSPGIIVAVDEAAFAVLVVWLNGDTTSEHMSYIKVINENR